MDCTQRPGFPLPVLHLKVGKIPRNIPYQVGTVGERCYSQVGKELRWRWDRQSMMTMLQGLLSPQRKGQGPCCYQVRSSLNRLGSAGAPVEGKALGKRAAEAGDGHQHHSKKHQREEVGEDLSFRNQRQGVKAAFHEKRSAAAASIRSRYQKAPWSVKFPADS